MYLAFCLSCLLPCLSICLPGLCLPSFLFVYLSALIVDCFFVVLLVNWLPWSTVCFVSWPCSVLDRPVSVKFFKFKLSNPPRVFSSFSRRWVAAQFLVYGFILLPKVLFLIINSQIYCKNTRLFIRYYWIFSAVREIGQHILKKIAEELGGSLSWVVYIPLRVVLHGGRWNWRGFSTFRAFLIKLILRLPDQIYEHSFRNAKNGDRPRNSRLYVYPMRGRQWKLKLTSSRIYYFYFKHFNIKVQIVCVRPIACNKYYW